MTIKNFIEKLRSYPQNYNIRFYIFDEFQGKNVPMHFDNIEQSNDSTNVNIYLD